MGKQFPPLHLGSKAKLNAPTPCMCPRYFRFVFEFFFALNFTLAGSQGFQGSWLLCVLQWPPTRNINPGYEDKYLWCVGGGEWEKAEGAKERPRFPVHEALPGKLDFTYVLSSFWVLQRLQRERCE